MYTTYAYIEAFASIVMLVLFVAGLSAKIKQNRILLGLIISFFLCLITHSSCYFLMSDIGDNITKLKVFWVSYMVFLSLCMIFFHRYILSFLKEKLGKKRFLFIYSEAVGLTISTLWLLSLFNGSIYLIENGKIIFNKLNYLIELLFAIPMFFDIFLIIKYNKYFNTRNTISLVSYSIVPFIFAFLSNVIDSTVFINLSISIVILLNYCMSHMETTSYLIKKENEIVEMNLELADKQHKLVYSQIQPHFLYNVLNTIYYLIDEDTEKGKQAIVQFSDYMRLNLDSINKPMLIDFSDELKKTDIYLSLEKLRFEDELSIKYDIETKSFKVPQLTLQPIIENAVKHGICKKKGGGTVTIYTREFDTYFELGVIDDGQGFDINEKKQDDSRSHVGLQNITYRIKHLCNGVVNIDSKVGEGTKVIIQIPKESAQ